MTPSSTWARETRAGDGAGRSLLEVACGTGRHNTFIRDNYPSLDVTALDLSQFYLEEARGHAKRWEAFAQREGRGHGAARFAQANAERLPYPDEAFDAARRRRR